MNFASPAEITTRNDIARDIIAGFAAVSPHLADIWRILDRPLGDCQVNLTVPADLFGAAVGTATWLGFTLLGQPEVGAVAGGAWGLPLPAGITTIANLMISRAAPMVQSAPLSYWHFPS
jgi:hypothetical protein